MAGRNGNGSRRALTAFVASCGALVLMASTCEPPPPPELTFDGSMLPSDAAVAVRVTPAGSSSSDFYVVTSDGASESILPFAPGQGDDLTDVFGITDPTSERWVEHTNLPGGQTRYTVREGSSPAAVSSWTEDLGAVGISAFSPDGTKYLTTLADSIGSSVRTLSIRNVDTGALIVEADYPNYASASLNPDFVPTWKNDSSGLFWSTSNGEGDPTVSTLDAVEGAELQVVDSPLNCLLSDWSGQDRLVWACFISGEATPVTTGPDGSNPREYPASDGRFAASFAGSGNTLVVSSGYDQSGSVQSAEVYDGDAALLGTLVSGPERLLAATVADLFNP